MLKLFTTPTCAYCVQVKKYLEAKSVPYTVQEAEGQEYQELASKYGYTVPLVYNGKDGMVGFNIAKLNSLI